MVEMIHDASRNLIAFKVTPESYPYEVDLDRVGDEAKLLSWVRHIGPKTWMDKKLLLAFIERVYAIKGWKWVQF
jgi:hypothetical protein